jgi:hypothetical protein
MLASTPGTEKVVLPPHDEEVPTSQRLCILSLFTDGKTTLFE